MWEDDGLINEIYGYIGQCESAVCAELDEKFIGGIKAEPMGSSSFIREYADGSHVEAVPIKISLRVKSLISHESVAAISALEKICRELEKLAYAGRIKGMDVTERPFKISERGGAADYGVKVTFYAIYSGDMDLLPLWYLNAGTSEYPTWERIGDGFTLFERRKEAETYIRRYIHSAEYVGSVVGYHEKILYSFEASSTCGAAELLRNADGYKFMEKRIEALEVLPKIYGDNCANAGSGERGAIKHTYIAASKGRVYEKGVLMYTGELLGFGGRADGVFDVDKLRFRPMDLTRQG